MASRRIGLNSGIAAGISISEMAAWRSGGNQASKRIALARHKAGKRSAAAKKRHRGALEIARTPAAATRLGAPARWLLARRAGGRRLAATGEMAAYGWRWHQRAASKIGGL